MTPPDRRAVADYLASLTDAEYKALTAEARNPEPAPVDRTTLVDRRVAGGYKPELDAETERVAKLDNLSPQQNMAIGYQRSARAATHRLNGDNQ